VQVSRRLEGREAQRIARDRRPAASDRRHDLVSNRALEFVELEMQGTCYWCLLPPSEGRIL